jgi:regulator of protease activity HflC (stomatin/prohibitin superfamily)
LYPLPHAGYAGRLEGSAVLYVVVIIVVVLVFLFTSSVRLVQEYERGVIFRLGRLVGARGPGVFFLIPLVERMIKVDLRILTLDVPAQETITRDNVQLKVDAVIYFRVIDPEAAVVNVLDYVRATSLMAQTTLRSVVGQSEMDELLAHREHSNAQLQVILDEQSDPWGIKVTLVAIRDVQLPESMRRAMARQAEAEREKRAKMIHAEGELAASEKLAAAAAIIGAEPAGLQLRFLQTLTEVAADKSQTVVFPLPTDLLRLIMERLGSPVHSR